MIAEEVDSVLSLFEGEGEKGKIKKASFRNWVVSLVLATELYIYSTDLKCLFFIGQVEVNYGIKALGHIFW